MVVRRYCTVTVDVRPEAGPLTKEILGGTPGFLGCVRPIPQDFQPLPDLVLDGFGAADQLLAADLTPFELVPQVESAVAGQLQHASLGSGFAHALQHALEVPTDVAVAKLMDRHLEYLVGFPSVAVDQAGKAISQQILCLLPASAGQEPERLGIFGGGYPQPQSVSAGLRSPTPKG